MGRCVCVCVCVWGVSTFLRGPQGRLGDASSANGVRGMGCHLRDLAAFPCSVGAEGLALITLLKGPAGLWLWPQPPARRRGCRGRFGL